MTRRRFAAAAAVLLGYVAAFAAACFLLPAESFAQTVVSDLGFLIPEVVVLVLSLVAFRWSRESRDKWIWMLVASWALLNLFADATWAYYEVFRQTEVPIPSLADVGYLPSYAVAVAVVLVAAWKTAGRLRAWETMIDATMLMLGAAGLMWPFILRPLLDQAGDGTMYWVTLAYPMGDLLFVLAFASFFLGSGPSRIRPQPYLCVICVGFLCQTVADAGYLVAAVVNNDYGPGSWQNPIWLLAFMVVGIAALIEIRAGKQLASEGEVPTAPPERQAVGGLMASRTGIAIPYLALPTVALMMLLQVRSEGWQWNTSMQVLTSLGLALVGLLLLKQYVTLTQNRYLNSDLYRISSELEGKVHELADLNQRLGVLNEQSHRLNTLHELRAVAGGGLELACTFAKSPGGWITMRQDDGTEAVTLSRGDVDEYHPGVPGVNAALLELGELRTIPLRIRGESLGALWLVRPEASGPGTDLLPVIATHLATALDNAKRYEEALHLAERDPLTGLFNHRGIHRRLAGAALRAQQNGTELSLVMIDLDDFKVLNDTYGHPAGDTVLKQVSDAIRAVLRHADLAGRVGGDELLVVLPNTGREGAFQLSERLRSALAARPYLTAAGAPVLVRLSLGVATFPEDAQSLGQLIETADANLYASKQRGGDTTTGNSPHTKADPAVQGPLGVAGRLLNAVGARDHYTRRHSESVVLHALSLGEALGLPDESLHTLHTAAMLHDVGNIGVPADLLRSAAPLTAGEREIVRRHAEIGAEVINDLPRLAEVAEAVRAHHERFDGNGYPEQTEGNDIPLLARILAVADAYSAMTVDRPYRKGMTHSQARDELLRVAGTQLDPFLVEEFVRTRDVQQQQRAVGSAAG
jgi:diguanylate cyclase (GGDEF)-like protein